MSIQRATVKVGHVLNQLTLDPSSKDTTETSKKEAIEKSADELYVVVVDGGHVHDADNKGHNFEVMVGKVYQPQNVVRIDKHHTSIVKKQCASSAKSDNQKLMKVNLLAASKKEGMNKQTTVTALADGASNCWNIIESLLPYCLTIIFILDWFHIGKYIWLLVKICGSPMALVTSQAGDIKQFERIQAF